MTAVDLQSISLEEDQAVDFRRDRWGRPLVVPAAGGKAMPYTRASSAAKAIEDTFNLEMWARRNVAYGMALDASLVARVIAIGGSPSTWSDDQRRAVAQIVTDAERIAQAHKGADLGTALHRVTERSDLGEHVDAGPFAGHLDAYRSTLTAAGILTHPKWIECRIVNDELEMAGTADRLVTLTPSSSLRRFLQIAEDEAIVTDLKTGKTVDYGGLGFAAQLAAYAGGDLYDPATDDRRPTPRINRRWGLIVHLPSTGEVSCTLHWVDLEAGYEAARLANQVRSIRKAARGWLHAVDLDTAAPVPDAPDVPAEMVAEAAAGLRERLRLAVEAGAAVRWPAQVPRFKDGGPRTWAEVLTVEDHVAAMEAAVGRPFPPEGSLPRDPTAPPDLRIVGDLPSGGGVDAAVSSPPNPAPGALLEVKDRLKALHDALPTDLRLAAHGLAMAAGVPSDRRRWTTDHLPTVERLLEDATAEHGKRMARLASVVADLDDDDFVGALLRTVGAEIEAADDHVFTAGDFAALTADQAEAFEHLADAYGSDPDAPVTLKVDDEGVLRIVPGPGAEAAVLASYGGSKADALAAAKELATLHGRPKPRSVAQAASDPLLVALLIADA